MSAQRQAKTAPGARAASPVIPFARPTCTSQRIADAQTLRRAQATKALEEVRKHLAAALAVLEPFKSETPIVLTVQSLEICAHSMDDVFEYLERIGLVPSKVLRNKAALIQLPPPERGRRC